MSEKYELRRSADELLHLRQREKQKTEEYLTDTINSEIDDKQHSINLKKKHIENTKVQIPCWEKLLAKLIFINTGLECSTKGIRAWV